MTAGEISPGLAALLEQVPADGELMTVTPRQLVRGLREGVEWARTRTTGLLPVERELLRRHREELAQVLLDACYVRAYAGPAGYKTVWKDKPLMDRASRSQDSWMKEARRHPELAGLRTASDLLKISTVTRLAHLADRIAPSIRGLFVQAIDCTLRRGQPRTAIQLLDRVRTLNPSPRLVSLAANNKAQALEVIGDVEASMACIKKDGDMSLLANPVNMFVYAAQLGLPDEMLQGLRAFQEHAERHPESARVIINGRRHAIREGSWIPTSKALPTARMIADRVDSWEKELLDVIL